jgi:DNA-binding NtrC family response regulator
MRGAALEFNARQAFSELSGDSIAVRRARPMPRILLIDDDAAVLGTLRTLLQKAGYETIEATDGREGRRMLDGIDLVITDLLMPEVDGVDLLGLMRKEGRTVPVIAMSGGGRVDPRSYLEVAKALGAYAALSKPFDLDVMLATVREALASRA